MRRPCPGVRVPRRGNWISRSTGRTLLRLFGWRIEGELPDLPRFVALAAPHTSNWDFFFGICAIFALGIRVDWIGKHTLFRWPFGPFMRWLGGTPVRRISGEGTVGQIVGALDRHDRWILGLAPEGTRKRVGRWKTGFYHVAVQANVPILLSYIDYRFRTIGFGPTFIPTGDIDHEIGEIREFYREKTPKRPNLFESRSDRE